MTESTYEFSYAINHLRQAIDYAQQTGEFLAARLWASRVEAAYNADISAEQELTRSANEGAKLLHSLATGGETSVLSRLDNGVDVQDAVRWQDEQPTIEAITVNGYAFNFNHAKIENDMRQKLADEYNNLFTKEK